MPKKKNRLIDLLQALVNALDEYLDDAEESGCDNYDPDRLVPIPRKEPPDYDPSDPSDSRDPVWLAWDIKKAVIDIQRAYAELGVGKPGPEGSPLPEVGLKLWEDLIAESRARESGVAIYKAGRDFRIWAKSELGRHPDRDKPRWDALDRTLYLGDEDIRQFRRNAKKAMIIMDCFQESDWPAWIDCPIGSRLDRVLDNINKGLRQIEFHQQSGGDQICWRFTHR